MLMNDLDAVIVLSMLYSGDLSCGIQMDSLDAGTLKLV